MDATKIGYEISFGRYIYKPTPLRTVEQIRTDILKLEQQTEGLLHKIVGAAQMAGKQTLTGHWCIGMPPAALADDLPAIKQRRTSFAGPKPVRFEAGRSMTLVGREATLEAIGFRI